MVQLKRHDLKCPWRMVVYYWLDGIYTCQFPSWYLVRMFVFNFQLRVIVCSVYIYIFVKSLVLTYRISNQIFDDKKKYTNPLFTNIIETALLVGKEVYVLAESLNLNLKKKQFVNWLLLRNLSLLILWKDLTVFWNNLNG